MREAIGSYWLTLIVITFIVLFTGYLCLSINVNKAYKVKNEIINIIQKNNGVNEDTLNQIQDYMTKIAYRTPGQCNVHGESGYDAYGAKTDRVKDGSGVFCIKEVSTTYDSDEYVRAQFPKTSYYQVKVFFSIDLPIVRNIFTFGLKGSTKKLFYPVGD